MAHVREAVTETWQDRCTGERGVAELWGRDHCELA